MKCKCLKESVKVRSESSLSLYIYSYEAKRLIFVVVFSLPKVIKLLFFCFEIG